MTVVFVCLPLIPSLSAYCLSWVSLTLDAGLLFTAAPATCSRCSLPQMQGSSSRPRLCAVAVKDHPQEKEMQKGKMAV